MDVTIRVKDLGHFSVPKFTKHDLGYSGMHYIYNYIYIYSMRIQSALHALPCSSVALQVLI